jgi:UDPglucose--hexose-1-phosphate uridylyltransferase
MSVLRKDPVTNGWVIIAEERAQRPSDFIATPPPSSDPGKCPFCGGNERLTPPEIRAVRPGGGPPNSPGWQVRVIPNKYAALRVEGDLDRRGVGMYDEMNGVGAHEVLIESPEHGGRMYSYSDEHLAAIGRSARERFVDLSRDQRFRYIQIFRNFGVKAGASLDHPHIQIIALPIVPRWVKEELTCARMHWERTERCVFCDIVNQERQDGDRLVFENDQFVAFEPFAAKFPFETWLIPKRHQPDFREVPGEDLFGLMEALRETLRALALGLADPPYNLVLHSAPFSAQEAELLANTAVDYHWHVEIIPRLTMMGGFEWGTGFHINTTAPETAAHFLREALAKA